MTDTPNEGETVVVSDSKTTGTPPAPVDTGEAEKLRKELEQARMREAQLKNELEREQKVKADAAAKELEEQNQYKALYEQERAKREGLETEAETKERLAEVAKAKKAVLSEYGDDVQALVEEVGIDLTDADDTTIAAFKEKVDKIDKRVASTKVGSNNQPTPNAPAVPSGDDLKRQLSTEQGIEDILANHYPGIAAMMTPKK